MPYRPRQSYGVPVNLRYISKPVLCRDATGIHGGSAGTLPATTGLKPGPPLSAGGVTVYRGSAGTLTAFTGVQPGHYRRQPELCRDAAGFHRCSTGALPATTGALSGLHRDKP
ncbi:hypothetical protein DPMN_100516 [Dreissena polymorpha]|uniref:Uncharacterized protein n=1 Tax=Dreissena polymorpha TaxID=45954 RepID=A0A9D4LG32_DREPO|nr:hypothetical protein DPMN_100516 [Dreissena polymorpha]